MQDYNLWRQNITNMTYCYVAMSVLYIPSKREKTTINLNGNVND